MPRRALAALAAFLGGLAPGPALAQPTVVLVIEGKGFGHGVGMPQDGAYAMAANGASAADILSRFYPGTSVTRRAAATVRVAVHESPGPVVVVLPGGGEVRDALSGPQSPGFPVTVNAGGSVHLAFDGARYKATPQSGASITRVAPPPAAPSPPAPAPPAPPAPAAPPPATTPTTGPLDSLLQALVPTTAPPTTAPPSPAPAPAATVPPGQADAQSSRGLWIVPKGASTVSLPEAGRGFRGTLQATGAGRGLHLLNDVDVEEYVRGLGEMPASWPAAALQAQAIAARTYALRAAVAGRTLCDDQQCQVYVGSGNEHPSTSAAAAATRGQVLTYRGALAEAVYSASAGGVSATPEEGFGPGSPDLPYLRPVEYQPPDPQLWAMTLPLREAAARFGYRGELQDVRVTRTGPSGRPLEITFEGSTGPMTVDGHRFWAVLRLRSTLFTIRTEVAEPAVEGDSLVAGVPDLSDFAGASGAGDHAAPVAPGRAAAETLGRAPWVGVAVLLMAAWANAATRVRIGGSGPVSSEDGPPVATEEEASAPAPP
ncbi:MAG: SpoIID/LytB domain-containing protein [Actinomycetota bacterium]|nr:SpoIID/LytB domain-containing protein [Actinomycetota bacterium]